MKYQITYLIVAAGLIFFSCETKINPTLQSADPILVVDAWITNKPETQTILLSKHNRILIMHCHPLRVELLLRSPIPIIRCTHSMNLSRAFIVGSL